MMIHSLRIDILCAISPYPPCIIQLHPLQVCNDGTSTKQSTQSHGACLVSGSTSSAGSGCGGSLTGRVCGSDSLGGGCAAWRLAADSRRDGAGDLAGTAGGRGLGFGDTINVRCKAMVRASKATHREEADDWAAVPVKVATEDMTEDTSELTDETADEASERAEETSEEGAFVTVAMRELTEDRMLSTWALMCMLEEVGGSVGGRTTNSSGRGKSQNDNVLELHDCGWFEEVESLKCVWSECEIAIKLQDVRWKKKRTGPVYIYPTHVQGTTPARKIRHLNALAKS